jgi:hypothetical protein
VRRSSVRELERTKNRRERRIAGDVVYNMLI